MLTIFTRTTRMLFTPTATLLDQTYRNSVLMAVLMASSSGVGTLVDCSGAALQYFDSIRTPAALIAGSSLGALFSLSQVSTSEQLREQPRLYRVVLLAHNFLALTALSLSIGIIVTASVSGNSLLLGTHNHIASTPFAMLSREFEFEYMLTRWSFYVGLLSFLQSVEFRTLIQFDLLKKEKLRRAMVVVLSFSSLVFHLQSFIHENLYSAPNLLVMSVRLAKLHLRRVFTINGPFAWLSLATLVGAVITAVSILFAELYTQSRRCFFVGYPGTGKN
jgi:hypothetical protein